MDFRAVLGGAEPIGELFETLEQREARAGRDLPIARGGWRRAAAQRRPTPLEALDGLKAAGTVPAHLRVAADRFEEVEVRLDQESETYWCTMSPSGRPSYTPGLLRGLQAMQRSLVDLFAAAPEGSEPPFRYFVVKSDHPGVFNLGGDLALFAGRIRAGDREGLSAYARACIEVVYANHENYGLPIVTIGLVQGDALGGGFEAALSCDVVVAERGTKCGFPEVLFNLFPGMGAYSFLARKVPGATMRDMIESGRLYDAEELHALGLVDIVAEPGEGDAAVEAYIARNRRRHNAHAAMHAAARRARPLEFAEMVDIVEMWVDAAMQLGPADLRKMERLVAAQDRRRAHAVA
ncbi:crotonase/enoyl-CoA hydratase family protein [Salinarimonas ramus]|uniref:Enoyl-CoA hydratase n=1 Tax=Salinarimonas ramus TaxID=690164 RepID=A0A917V5Y6_9HYPH|nr:crotonase/enoyl-CoA hydratase family protein [Salinarimonas ramus]GGK41594.1 enoyl-CoA hydratase [Salinarimonas ramus]